MVRLDPSPDWFVGVTSFDLCEKKRWQKHIKVDLFPMDAGTDKGLTFTSPNWVASPSEPVYPLSPRHPPHSASAFYYSNMTSLPPIAKVYLTKVAEYRRKGKEPTPLKEESNLVVFTEDSEANENPEKVLPTLEKLIDNAIVKSKEAKQNAIEAPRAEPLVGR